MVTAENVLFVGKNGRTVWFSGAPLLPGEGAAGDACRVVCGREPLPGRAEGRGCISGWVSHFQPTTAKPNPPPQLRCTDGFCPSVCL